MNKNEKTQVPGKKSSKSSDDTIKPNGRQKQRKPNLPSEDYDNQLKPNQGKRQHQGITSTSSKRDENSPNEDKDAEPEDNYKDVILKSKKGDSDSVLNEKKLKQV